MEKSQKPKQPPTTVHILIGASGVLGTAVRQAFVNAHHEVLGLSHTRSGEGLQRLDLTQDAEVEKVFSEFKPNYYVFDGTSPPYTPLSQTNPLQLYGQSKRDGELAVLAIDSASVIVLRVPVLYGPAPNNSDSAINILLDVVQDQSGKNYKMDHYATRYPTNVVDIANFLVRLSGYRGTIPPVLHYSAAEPFTKYEICLVFAKILNLPHGHIVPDAEPPTGAGATTRPRDCQLYTRETEDLRVGQNGDASLDLSLFEEWWSEHLRK
ncbi:hypothetical protein H0H92_013709 [Tricholoma furcatifolium]|nr:hypothetical protein H0H92_013709 [Tricholoma furcatifolium]